MLLRYGPYFVSQVHKAKAPNKTLDVVRPAQYIFKIKELHEKYGKQLSKPTESVLTGVGPILRIGPNDVSISDPDFVDTIYAPGPGHKRDKDHEKNKALGVDS